MGWFNQLLGHSKLDLSAVEVGLYCDNKLSVCVYLCICVTGLDKNGFGKGIRDIHDLWKVV